MERFVIIDGNAILHRAYHAMPPLTTSSGQLVNAVYGFASMLFKVRDNLKPSYFAVTFDLPKPTFRKKIFVDYQIKRPKMDEELSGQIEKVKEMVRVLGIPIYEKEGYEADDVIGTLACQSQVQSSKFKVQSQIETIIVTGDRDILQLVDEKTKVYMPTKGLSEAVLFDDKKVEEKLGIPAKLIPDYKGLVGDQSDNYPGVSGIGPKTAVDLLLKYKDFNGIYRNLEEVKGGVREKLEKGKEGGEMSFRLATIVKDVPVSLDLKICRFKDFDRTEVRDFFEKMEFRSLVKRLEGKGKKPSFASTSAKATVDKKASEGEKDKNQMSLFQ